MANEVNASSPGSLGVVHISNPNCNFNKIRAVGNSSSGGSGFVYKAADVTVTTIDVDKYLSADSTKAKLYQGERSTQYIFDGSGGKYKAYNIEHKEFYVPTVVAGTNLFDYVDYIKNKKLYQLRNKTKRKGWCQNIAYCYCYGFYKNIQNYGESNLAHGNCGGKFDAFIDSNKNHVLEAVYNEITNGRPCIIQVNGDTKGTSRHFVVVVGFSSKVKSGSDLKETDLLILDPWDGKLYDMSQPGARFMTTGAKCDKDYQGYYMLYIRRNTKNTQNVVGDANVQDLGDDTPIVSDSTVRDISGKAIEAYMRDDL